ncbi:hypothetical protein AAFF_G00054050 [Aldrovandia affinis]|uniref:Uncharacterized protein n=1 Tax=Aldrovandia affinis TaxID=143900 RepID=A0AAD7WEF6_9TELE|nr:hypothetical protein AAFF_G00054050 [Aldrovandia affinis]
MGTEPQAGPGERGGSTEPGPVQRALWAGQLDRRSAAVGKLSSNPPPMVKRMSATSSNPAPHPKPTAARHHHVSSVTRSWDGARASCTPGPLGERGEGGGTRSLWLHRAAPRILSVSSASPLPTGGARSGRPGPQVARLFKARPWAGQTQEITFYGLGEALLFYVGRKQWPTRPKRVFWEGSAQMDKSLHARFLICTPHCGRGDRPENCPCCQLSYD